MGVIMNAANSAEMSTPSNLEMTTAYKHTNLYQVCNHYNHLAETKVKSIVEFMINKG